MKREDVLFYLNKHKVYLYFMNLNKEIIEDIDSSSFFKFSEISDVELCFSTLTELINPYFNSNLLKPDIYILYNDISNADLKHLYKASLDFLNYRNLIFVELSHLISKLNSKDKIVYFDGDGYTVFKDKVKIKFLNELDFEPILIGAKSNHYLYYSDENIIWETFKSYFTNQ